MARYSVHAAVTVAVSAFIQVSLPVIADAQVTICRSPGFYQTHSGEEKDSTNVGQEVINDGGPIEVCGEVIVRTDDIGSIDSLLEGLCIRVQGEEVRQLNRQLLTAKLNCQVSEGADCDEIVGRFVNVSWSECNALCAGDPVGEEPTIEQCIEELDCFNSGGRMIDGQCATGTCNDDGVTECEDDEDCGVDIECVRFEDSCANTQFCSDELQAEATICPKKGPASSPKICREARKNGCTIDDVDCYRACADGDACVAACEATPGCDPSVACDTQVGCIETCVFGGFGDGNGTCGCEFQWAQYCSFNAGSESEFIQCFLDYQLAQFFDFCQLCGEDPTNCPIN